MQPTEVSRVKYLIDAFRFVIMVIAIWGGAMPASNGAEQGGRMCVVRIVEGRYLWQESPSVFYRVVVEGVGKELISVKVILDGKPSVLPSDRQELFDRLCERLRQEDFSINPEDGEKLGRGIEGGGTADFAIVSIFRSSGWILRSNSKFYEMPSVLSGKIDGDKEMQLRPNSIFSVSEFYFESARNEK